MASSEVPYTENRKRENTIVGRIFCVKIYPPCVSEFVGRAHSLALLRIECLTRCELVYKACESLRSEQVHIHIH